MDFYAVTVVAWICSIRLLRGMLVFGAARLQLLVFRQATTNYGEVVLSVTSSGAEAFVVVVATARTE